MSKKITTAHKFVPRCLFICCKPKLGKYIMGTTMTNECKIEGQFAVTEEGDCAALGICIADNCPVRRHRGTTGMTTPDGSIVGATMQWNGKVPFRGPHVAEQTGPYVTEIFHRKCKSLRNQQGN